MTKATRCRQGQCTWVPLRGGKSEKCSTCGCTFPCKRCGHYDCQQARGEPSPLDTPAEREAHATRLLEREAPPVHPIHASDRDSLRKLGEAALRDVAHAFAPSDRAGFEHCCSLCGCLAHDEEHDQAALDASAAEGNVREGAIVAAANAFDDDGGERCA